MSDETPTTLRELASAAFDGEITPDERARVETSTELSAEVASYAMIRDQIGAVGVPTPSRERALATALAVFDELLGHVPAVVSLNARRQRQQRWLAGAAAAVALAVVVGGVVNSSGEDKKSGSQSFDTAARSAAIPANVELATTGTQVASAGSTPTADASAASGGGINAVSGPAVVTPWALAPNFATAKELANYAVGPTFGQTSQVLAPASPITPGTSATPAPSTARSATASDTAQKFITTCLNGITSAFAAVVYQGQQVLAIRDDQAKVLRVIDPRTCAVVLTVSLL